MEPLADGSDDRPPRFEMLETIREFALEHLAASGDAESAHDAHADYFLALAAEAEPHLIGPDQLAWLDLLEQELPNLRAALGWLRVRGRIAEGLRLATAPGRFWWRRGFLSEGRTWLDSFLALPEVEGVSLVRIRALIVAGDIAAWQKDNEHALSRHGEAAALARSLGDAWGVAMALYGLGSDAVDREELPQAEPLLAESLAHFRAIGDTWGAALARSKQGILALAQGDHVRADVYLKEALAVFRERQDWRFVAGVLDELGHLALARGDGRSARRAQAEALALSVSLGDRTGIAWGLMGQAGVAALVGRAEQATRLLGAAATLREVVGARLAPQEQAMHDQIEADAQAALGAAGFAAAWVEGAALPLADAVAEAIAVAGGEADDGEARAEDTPLSDGHPPSLHAGLTPREMEVLHLLVGGQSDREIAAALSITRRTASTHVSAILAKLRQPSRSAAVAHAMRHRLV